MQEDTEKAEDKNERERGLFLISSRGNGARECGRKR